MVSRGAGAPAVSRTMARVVVFMVERRSEHETCDSNQTHGSSYSLSFAQPGGLINLWEYSSEPKARRIRVSPAFIVDRRLGVG